MLLDINYAFFVFTYLNSFCLALCNGFISGRIYLIVSTGQFHCMLPSNYSKIDRLCLIMLDKREWRLKLKPQQQIHLCAHCNNFKKEMVSKHENRNAVYPTFSHASWQAHLQYACPHPTYLVWSSIQIFDFNYRDVPDIQLITKKWAVSQIQ